MIRIYKHPIAPKSLDRHASWKEDDVTLQLMSDQHDKCYLCERKLGTDFQVDHLKSRANHPEFSYKWSNLLCACSYCNGKKSNGFDDILNPLENDMEDLIFQEFDFPNTKVLFRSEIDNTKETTITIELLDRIFNGTGKLRTHREQKFYDESKSKITSFLGMCDSWLKTGAEDVEKAIKEELDVDAEFLGFKYWIIAKNSRLFSEFGKHLVWNKK